MMATSRIASNPPGGQRVNPYCKLAYAAIDCALESRLTGAALRILLFAMKADRGNNRNQLRLGITGVCTGAQCNRSSAVAGLKELTDCGLLVRLDDRGHYRLGPAFAKFIPADAGATEQAGQENQGRDTDEQTDQDQDDVVTSDTAYADDLFSIWKQRADASGTELELDAAGRKRTEEWAAERVEAGADPVADFRTSLAFFLERGHTILLRNGKTRNPGAYAFKGFMRVCTMFLRHAVAAQRKEDLGDDAPQHDTANVAAESVVAAPVPKDISGIPQDYPPFITGKDSSGRFTYRQGEITSAEELARVYEHAFELVGTTVRVAGVKSAMMKCVEDLADMLAGADAGRVVMLVKIAKHMSMQEQQQEYFSGRPFNFHTARTLFADALAELRGMDSRRAEREAEEKRQIDSGERRQEHFGAIRLGLSYIAADLRISAARRVRQGNIEMFERDVSHLVRDYGRPAAGSLPQDITNGVWCLAMLGAIDIPECLADAIGDKPEMPDFSWIPDAAMHTALFTIWAERLRDGATTLEPPPHTRPAGGGDGQARHNTVRDSGHPVPGVPGLRPAAIAAPHISQNTEPPCPSGHNHDQECRFIDLTPEFLETVFASSENQNERMEPGRAVELAGGSSPFHHRHAHEAVMTA